MRFIQVVSKVDKFYLWAFTCEGTSKVSNLSVRLDLGVIVVKNKRLGWTDKTDFLGRDFMSIPSQSTRSRERRWRCWRDGCTKVTGIQVYSWRGMMMIMTMIMMVVGVVDMIQSVMTYRWGRDCRRRWIIRVEAWTLRYKTRCSRRLLLEMLLDRKLSPDMKSGWWTILRYIIVSVESDIWSLVMTYFKNSVQDSFWINMVVMQLRVISMKRRELMKVMMTTNQFRVKRQACHARCWRVQWLLLVIMMKMPWRGNCPSWGCCTQSHLINCILFRTEIIDRLVQQDMMMLPVMRLHQMELLLFQ